MAKRIATNRIVVYYLIQKETFNYLVYPRASIFYGNSIEVKVAARKKLAGE